MTDTLFDALRRWPDLEAPELFAVDAADRLVLDELSDAISAGIVNADDLRESLVIMGDNYGALTLGAAARFGHDAPMAIRLHQDSRSGQIALEANAADVASLIPESATWTQQPLSSALVRDARVVLMRLPRSLAQLSEWSALIAAHAHPDVVVFATGRIKHMTVTMNDVVDTFFAERHISHAVQKSRVIRCAQPRNSEARAALSDWPRRTHHSDIDMTVCATGGVFAGDSVDIGTRVLLGALDAAGGASTVRRVIDLGCGSGILAVAAARLWPDAEVIASDNSAAAVVSARATAAANGLEGRITVVHDDGLQGQPDGSADVIVFNPPFHTGATVHKETSYRLFADAARVLREGGQLWVVANSHLEYRPVLSDIVGPTRQAVRTPKFTVFVSTRQVWLP